MIAKIPAFGWGGLNTRAQSTGLPLLECVVLQDMRVVGEDLMERLGIVRVAQFTGDQSACHFNGTDEYCDNAVDTRAWSLGLNWTVEVLIEPAVTTGVQGILTVGHTTPAMILDITGGDIRFRVWDTADAATTITVGAAAASIQSVQIVRSGSVVSTRLNNGTAVTGAISDSLAVRAPVGNLRSARDDGNNYFHGTTDYVRLFSYSKANHADRRIRCPNPRASYVRADYDFNISSGGGLIYDRSRYQAHLIAQNTPTEIATLCHNPAPVRALSMMTDENNRKQLLILAGGKYYLASVD